MGIRFFFFIISAKKTKTMAVDSATHSGPASPDSGGESTDNGELGTECGVSETAPTFTAAAMTATTTEDPDAGPDAFHHSTDNQAPRFADLDSPADRYVPLPLLPSLSRDDRALFANFFSVLYLPTLKHIPTYPPV